MLAAIKRLFDWMPLLFGIGFIAPLVAQTMTLAEIAPPFGMDHVLFGLAIGVPWGLYAMLRGRWI